MDFERRRLRATLKWALRPDPWHEFDRAGELRELTARKLDGLISYGMVDKTGLSERAIKSVQMHYIQGIPIENIAHHYLVSPRTIAGDITMVLDYIIDHTPKRLLVSFCPIIYQWKIKGCPHCGGDLYWDSVGVYGGDGEYCCLMCSRRFDINGQPLRKAFIFTASL